MASASGNPPARRKSPVREIVETVVIALVIALFVRTFVVAVFVVEGRSMVATMHDAERLLVNRFIYRFRAPQPGEIIVFRYPRQPDRDFIKRVVAVAGDKVEIRAGKVYVNDELMPEAPTVQPDLRDVAAATVPPNSVWVLGDNRGSSEDSRFFGEVPFTHIKGQAFLRFWPPTELSVFRNPVAAESGKE